MIPKNVPKQSTLHDGISRRRFIQAGTAALAFGAGLKMGADQKSKSPGTQGKPLRLGIISDVHHGLQPDAIKRLESFIQAMEAEKPDLIIQLGDFCYARPESREFVEVWEQFKGPRYHVLGNHDMDRTTKQETMDFIGMRAPHYSFDAGDFHFVVLDCNYILNDGEYVNYANRNYFIEQARRDRINPEQVEWLRADLAGTQRQTFIFSHQAFDENWSGWSVPNRLEVRAVIREANQKAMDRTGAPHVIACFSGHHHIDEVSEIEGVQYMQMNSASYYWTGGKFGSEGPRAVYSKPLYALVTLDPSGQIGVKGQAGEFHKPTPADTGFPAAKRLTAAIIDRTIKFPTAGQKG
ncbi:MAG: metallophosphoesterase [Verrucomicrobia bacterium]|nr:metallophosphoesterase [Verrucomicrobiota bacterium]